MGRTAGKGKWSADKTHERRQVAARLRSIRREPERDRGIGELALTYEYIEPELRLEEPHLATTCWHQYGYMTPLERTEAFCRVYVTEYRYYFRKYKDAITADSRHPVSSELMANERGDITSLWRARQEADRLGMPYRSYLSEAIDWAGSQANRRALPQPNQLYGAQQLEKARASWAEKWVTKDPVESDWDIRFTKDNPRMDPPRMQALKFLIRRMDQARLPERLLARALGGWNLFSENEVRLYFRNCPKLLEEAIRIARPNMKPASALDHAPYRPSCLGVTSAISNAPCNECTFVEQCRSTYTKAQQRMQAETGSADPHGDRKRRINRDRQRRKRDRDRAARAGLTVSEFRKERAQLGLEVLA